MSLSSSSSRAQDGRYGAELGDDDGWCEAPPLPVVLGVEGRGADGVADGDEPKLLLELGLEGCAEEPPIPLPLDECEPAGFGIGMLAGFGVDTLADLGAGALAGFGAELAGCADVVGAAAFRAAVLRGARRAGEADLRAAGFRAVLVFRAAERRAPVFAPVERRAALFRAVDLRAGDLRAEAARPPVRRVDALRAVDVFRAPVLRAGDFRAALLRAGALRVAVLRAPVFRAAAPPRPAALRAVVFLLLVERFFPLVFVAMISAPFVAAACNRTHLHAAALPRITLHDPKLFRSNRESIFFFRRQISFANESGK